MSDTFLSLRKSVRREFLDAAAQKKGMTSKVLEKDIWVCWTLKALFSMPNAYPMAFKGGTSLSMVYSVINRFSEDVDVTLDRRKFAPTIDPLEPEISKGEVKRRVAQLNAKVQNYRDDEIIPYFRSRAEGEKLSGGRGVERRLRN